MKAYKLRNKRTGLYATNTRSYVAWSRTGKAWSQKGHLKRHMEAKLEHEVDEWLRLLYNSDWQMPSHDFYTLQRSESERAKARRAILEEWEVLEIELNPSPETILNARKFLWGET